MVKKSIMLGVLIIMGLGLFTGCSSGISFKLDYKGMDRFVYTDDVEDLDLVKIINSLEELMAYCDEVNNPAFNEDSSLYSSDLSKKIREYGETFFAEKSLIIYMTKDYRGGGVYRIKGLEIEDEELVLDIHRRQRIFGLYSPIFNIVFLIEVNKEDIVGITNIKIK